MCIRDREITIPAGTMGDIVNALNDPTPGFGIYGNYALDSAGKLKWTPTASSEGFTMNMTQDVAPRGNTSVSYTHLDVYKRQAFTCGKVSPLNSFIFMLSLIHI